MQIIFICGCLEPAHDGVGDYTRRLAIELIRQGNKVSIIAVNDKYINNVHNGMQFEGSIQINVLRLPSELKESKRFQYVEESISTKKPDLISLQFVSFSFHPKGLSLTIKRLLRTAGKGICWHIMFHELWVGMGQASSLKLVIWGKLQKQLIRSLIVGLRPVVMHTQTGIYKLQLEKIGFHAKHLPLFSNIPVINQYRSIQPHNLSLLDKGKKTISLVLFGGIQFGAPVDAFAKEAASYSRENNINLLLRIVGRSGIEQQRWEVAWKAMGLDVEILGEQSVEIISNVLKTSSFGISTTPLALVEKSSTNAAMREHGLPILCVINNWKAKGFSKIPPPDGIFEYQPGNLKKCLRNATKIVSDTTVREIAQKFLKDISVIPA